MQLLKTLIARPLFLAVAGFMTTATVAAEHAAGWAWKHRVLVIFAPDSTDRNLLEQRQRLSGMTNALVERDMLVVEIVAGDVETRFGSIVQVNARAIASYLGKSDAAFEVVLFGKDTGVKMRKDKPVRAQDVFALIDAMPMRRQEMRQQGN